MEPWGTPARTGYFFEEFPSSSTRSRLLMSKNKIRPNTSPKILWNLNLWRRPAKLNSVESAWYIRCYSSGSPRPIKSPSNNSIRYLLLTSYLLTIYIYYANTKYGFPKFCIRPSFLILIFAIYFCGTTNES